MSQESIDLSQQANTKQHSDNLLFIHVILFFIIVRSTINILPGVDAQSLISLPGEMGDGLSSYGLCSFAVSQNS